MKIIFIFLFLTGITASQTIQQKHLSVVTKRIAEVGGGSMPTIVYADSAFNNFGDSLDFTHWGSIEANQLILLIHINEKDFQQWGALDDTVSEAGWVYIGEEGIGNTSDIGAYYKIATGDETGSFYSRSKDASENAGWYLVLDNVDTSDPLNIKGTGSELAASDTIVLLSVETDEANCLVFGLMTCDGSDWPGDITYSNSGWSFYKWIFNRIHSFTSGGSIGLKELVSAGASGDVTVNVGVVDGIAGFQFAIKGTE